LEGVGLLSDVALSRVPKENQLAVVPGSGRYGFQLFPGKVLSLIDQDYRVLEGAAPDRLHGLQLDNPGLYCALNDPFTHVAFEVTHDWGNPGSQLVLYFSRKSPQRGASRYIRSYKNNLCDVGFLIRLGRKSGADVGLPGPGGPIGHSDAVVLISFYECPLSVAAGDEGRQLKFHSDFPIGVVVMARSAVFPMVVRNTSPKVRYTLVSPSKKDSWGNRLVADSATATRAVRSATRRLKTIVR
jgi:hypothetical protein